MADVSKIKLPNNTVVNIKDYRIPGVDTSPTSGSENVVTSGGVKTALNGMIPYGATLMPTNPFGGKGVYINSMDNAFHSAEKRFWVKITLHSKTISGVSYPYADTSKEITDPDYWVDSPVIITLTNANAANLFNGSYESNCVCPAGQYMKIHIQFSPFSDSWNPATAPRLSGYPYGSYYLSYYYQNTPGRASQLRVYNTYATHTVGWHLYSPSIFSGSLTANYIECFTDNGDYSRTCVEFIIYGRDSGNTSITQIDYKLTRPDLAYSGSTVTKYGDQSLYHNFRWYKHNDEAQPTNTITISPESGTITADKLVKFGGSASQFLKADGSVDSNTYVTVNQLPVIDSVPTSGSTNAVSSGGVYTELLDVAHMGDTVDTATYVDGDTVVDLADYAKKTWVENKGYLTQHQTLKTINNQSLIGSGNINISGGSGGGEENVIESITFNGSAVPVTNKNATITASIPTESTVSGWGFTKNTGTLTGVKFNNVSATVSNGIASITATIPSAPGTLKTNNTTAQTASASESLSGTINLHKIAKTGNFSDLLGTHWVMTINSSHELTAVNGDGITCIMGDEDGSLYALGAGNANGNEDYILATTDQIPTESTVSGWGFTKNTGTYSKPSGGIPKTDLASAVQTSLGKADTALQSYTETDPVFTASVAHGITSTDISNWNAKQKAITVSSSEPTSSQGSNGDIWIVI